MHRYRGEVRGGTWRIVETYPAVSADTLHPALALAAEIGNGTRLAIADADEGKRILKWADENFGPHIEDNLAKVAGDALVLKEEDAGILSLDSCAAFPMRFRSTWPVWDLSDDDEDEE